MKITPFGVAVVEGDTHISEWVSQHGTLRIAKHLCQRFKKYVPNGGVVVDAGETSATTQLNTLRWLVSLEWCLLSSQTRR